MFQYVIILIMSSQIQSDSHFISSSTNFLHFKGGKHNQASIITFRLLTFILKFMKSENNYQIGPDPLDKAIENRSINHQMYSVEIKQRIVNFQGIMLFILFFVTGLYNIFQFNIREIESLKDFTTHEYLSVVLLGISGMFIMSSLFYAKIGRYTFSANKQCLAATLSIITLSLTSDIILTSPATFIIIVLVSEVLIINLEASIIHKTAYVSSILLANYVMNAKFIDLMMQAILVIVIMREDTQRQGICQVFFEVIDSLREDIQNNTNYVAGVVHDLRNPLTEIFSCAELLGQTLPDHLITPEMNQIISAFKRNSENLISMVNNILDYAKIKSKKLELDYQPLNIREFLNNIIEMHQIKARQKSINLKMTIQDDMMPEKLFIDQSRFTNILVNLTSNAIKFTSNGSVQVIANWLPDNSNNPTNIDELIDNDSLPDQSGLIIPAQKVSMNFQQFNQHQRDMPEFKFDFNSSLQQQLEMSRGNNNGPKIDNSKNNNLLMPRPSLKYLGRDFELNHLTRINSQMSSTPKLKLAFNNAQMSEYEAQQVAEEDQWIRDRILRENSDFKVGGESKDLIIDGIHVGGMIFRDELNQISQQVIMEEDEEDKEVQQIPKKRSSFLRQALLSPQIIIGDLHPGSSLMHVDSNMTIDDENGHIEEVKEFFNNDSNGASRGTTIAQTTPEISNTNYSLLNQRCNPQETLNIQSMIPNEQSAIKTIAGNSYQSEEGYHHSLGNAKFGKVLQNENDQIQEENNGDIQLHNADVNQSGRFRAFRHQTVSMIGSQISGSNLGATVNTSQTGNKIGIHLQQRLQQAQSISLRYKSGEDNTLTPPGAASRTFTLNQVLNGGDTIQKQNETTQKIGNTMEHSKSAKELMAHTFAASYNYNEIINMNQNQYTTTQNLPNMIMNQQETSSQSKTGKGFTNMFTLEDKQSALIFGGGMFMNNSGATGGFMNGIGANHLLSNENIRYGNNDKLNQSSRPISNNSNGAFSEMQRPYPNDQSPESSVPQKHTVRGTTIVPTLKIEKLETIEETKLDDWQKLGSLNNREMVSVTELPLMNAHTDNSHLLGSYMKGEAISLNSHQAFNFSGMHENLPPTGTAQNSTQLMLGSLNNFNFNHPKVIESASVKSFMTMEQNDWSRKTYAATTNGGTRLISHVGGARVPKISKESWGILMIQIIDTGIGIKSELQKKLFQPFGQAHKGIQKSFGGTGLGLWISKMIVELMGGSIELVSKENQGSTFTIKIKLRVAKSDPSSLSDVDQIKKVVTLLSQSQSNGYNSIAMRKLIVLSDPFSARLLKGYVEPFSFTVKQIQQPTSLIQEMNEQVKRCIIFDEEYQPAVLKYVQQFKKKNQFILVALKSHVQQQKSNVRAKLAGINYMSMEAQIDYTIRKPIQKDEFCEIFNKILLQMHLSLNQTSRSMNELFYNQSQQVTDTMPKGQDMIRATSAFIKDMRQGNASLSFNRQSDSGFDQSNQSPDNLRVNLSSFFSRAALMGGIKKPNHKNLYGGMNGNNPRNNNTVNNQSGATRIQQSSMQQQMLNQMLQQQQAPDTIVTPLSIQSMRPKLLVVDDSEFLQKAMVMIIEKIRSTLMLNFEIITATDGQEAINEYVKWHRDIKLIMMDIQMPVMDGYEGSRCIREFEESHAIEPKSYIVALSGDSTLQHERRCRLIGINETIVKPISRQQLEQLLAVYK